jgi:hypothetical protein
VKQHCRHFPLIQPAFSAKSAGWAAVTLLFALSGLRAADLPPPVTLDLPLAANQATPAWLGHPETPATAFAMLDLPILTPDPNASLLVTVFFQEKQGGFLRVAWMGTQGAQLLSDNFYEGTGMSNQRSLLISAATLVGDGTLTFQCGDSSLGIQRIKLEWLENKTALVSPDVQDGVVVPATGPTLLAQSLNGQPAQTAPGAWQGQLVSVPLTDQPVRIEQGVDFSVDLDTVPGVARLALQEAGLPLGKHLVVWINQERAGTITPAVPDLIDDGFITGTDASISYVGWRDGSFYAPVSFLKAGVNTVQFSVEDEVADPTGAAPDSDAATELPLALKNIVLQLNYQPPQAKAGVLQPQISADPTGPIPPGAPLTDPQTP